MNEVMGKLPPNLFWEAQTNPPAKNEMGKDQFMTLLLAQLQNQDPMKPLDNKDFSAQLAQFGSLEQLSNIEKGIQQLRTGSGQGHKLQAIGMIGKQIEANGAGLNLEQGKGLSFKNSLSPTTKPIRAVISDSNGRIAREIDLTSQSSSETIEWDGKDASGKELPGGTYAFRLIGLRQDGSPEEASSKVTGKVVGVDMNADIPVLTVDTPQGRATVSLNSLTNVQSPKPNTSNSSVTTAESSIEKPTSVNAKDGKTSPMEGERWGALDRGLTSPSYAIGRYER